MRFYGLDLRGEIQFTTLRRLWVLVKGLPPESATWAGEERWTRQDELLASLIEVTDAWSRNLFAALGGEVKGKPLEVRRPSMPEPKKKVTTDTRQIAAWFAAHSHA